MPNCEILTIYKSIYNFLLFEEVATFHPNFLCPLQLFKFLGKILFRNATFPSFPFIENKEKKKSYKKLDHPSIIPRGITESSSKCFQNIRFVANFPSSDSSPFFLGENWFLKNVTRMSAMCLRWLLRYERGAITFFSCRLNERN